MSLAVGGGLVRLLGLLLLDLVGLDPVQEIGPALGVSHVLDPDGDPLGQDPALDALVDDDADGVLGHVEDAPGLSVVGLVGHSFLEGSVALHVHDVSGLVHLEVGGQMLHDLGLVGATEHVAGSATVSGRVRHLGRVGGCREKSQQVKPENKWKRSGLIKSLTTCLRQCLKL